ncbi:MAG: hypothetical protein V4591_10670 [Bdellovibrionota bacterium]
MNKIIIFLFLFFFCACTTTQKPKLVSVAPDSDIYFVSRRLGELCTSSHSPQFLAEFAALNSGSEFQLEGAWKNNYTVLNMQILGPFGEQYAYFELNGHKLNVFSERKNILENPEIKNLVNFVSSIGALNLRKIFCGSYVFNQEKKNENIFVQNDSYLKEDKYITENQMAIDGHAIEMKSDLDLADSDNDVGYVLTMNSQFSFGFLNSDTHLAIEWMGYIDDEQVLPKIINFNYEKSKYELKILDYN